MTLLRRVLGDTLRGRRLRQRRTLREVSGAARVSLGYLSEVERGQKEASSELLASICAALDVRLSDVLREVSDNMRRTERAADLALAPARQLVPAGAVRSASGAGTPVELPVGRDGAELAVGLGRPAEFDRGDLVDRVGLDADRPRPSVGASRRDADRADAGRFTPERFDAGRFDPDRRDLDRRDLDRRDLDRTGLDGVDLADLETGDGLGDVDALLSLTDLSCCLGGPHHATTCGTVAAA
jgi:transcriptional regulator with XRE-family HTH domain